MRGWPKESTLKIGKNGGAGLRFLISGFWFRVRASGVGPCSSAALSAEANGGTLVLNAAYLKRGFDFAGVAFEGKTFEVSGNFGDDRGQTFPIAGVYDALALRRRQ